MSKKKKDKIINELNVKIQKYENVIHKLIYDYKQLLKKGKNERGAGRKPKFNKAQIDIIRKYRIQGNTISSIAKAFKCSNTLIYNLVKDIDV